MAYYLPDSKDRHLFLLNNKINLFGTLGGLETMIVYIVYALAIVVLILHFTGWLKRQNMEWIVLLAPVAIFAIIILDYLKII